MNNCRATHGVDVKLKAVTIDQLDIKDHVRWAQDQEVYDISFVKDSDIVAQQPEILGTSVIYPSKFDELFELQKRNLPWATFLPPGNFHTFSKRFFSYRLFPHIFWKEEDEDEEEREQGEEDSEEGLISAIINCKPPENQKESLFEKDKSSVLNLLESIKEINGLLKQINARKLQYQKG